MKAYVRLVESTAKNLVRDRMTLFWFFAFPVLFILLFGAIFSGDMTDMVADLRVGFVGEEGTISSVMGSALKQVPAFTVFRGGQDEELDALRNGERSLVIVMSPGADAHFERGNPIPITLFYDESSQTINHVLMSSVTEILLGIERQFTGSVGMFGVERQGILASGLRGIDFLLPGILAMALMQLGLFGSLHVVGLRERKVLKQLSATPLPRALLISSEVTVRLVMALVQALLIVVVGRLVFGVTISGSWLAVVGIVLLGAATFVSMGYMLVSFARTEDSGMGIIQLVQFPMMFLSGIFFDVDMMPDFLRPIISAMPLTYLGDALRQVMVGMTPIQPLAVNVGVLTAWLVVSLVLGVRFFRWE